MILVTIKNIDITNLDIRQIDEEVKAIFKNNNIKEEKIF